MPQPKPRPPALHVVVSEADEIARQLAALGVVRNPSLEDRVYDALVAGWRSLGKAPKLSDIAVQIGSPATSVNGALRRLQAKGRVLWSKRGEWVPKVV